MARARNIKPGFFRNLELSRLPFGCRLLFAGLWTIADREGRLKDQPECIAADIFPFDRDAPVEEWLSLLASGDDPFIVRYSAGNKRYIAVRTWHKHQNPHCKEQASAIPAPVEHGASMVQAQCLNKSGTEVAGLIPSSLIPSSLIPEAPLENAAEKVPDPIPPDLPRSEKFDEFWELYPRKRGSKPAKAAWRSKARTVRVADEIISGLKAQLPSFLTKEIQFIPYAQKWLNEERWKDPIEQPSRNGNGIHSGSNAPNPAMLASSLLSRWEK